MRLSARILAALAVAALVLAGVAGAAHASTPKLSHVTAYFVTPAQRSGQYDSLLVREDYSNAPSRAYGCDFPTETIDYEPAGPITKWASKGKCGAFGTTPAPVSAQWQSLYAAGAGTTLTVRIGTATLVCRHAHERDTYGSHGAFTLALDCAV